MAPYGTATRQRIRETFVQSEPSPAMDRQLNADHTARRTPAPLRRPSTGRIHLNLRHYFTLHAIPSNVRAARFTPIPCAAAKRRISFPSSPETPTQRRPILRGLRVGATCLWRPFLATSPPPPTDPIPQIAAGRKLWYTCSRHLPSSDFGLTASHQEVGNGTC
jgi:hypothetical protein